MNPVLGIIGNPFCNFVTDLKLYLSVTRKDVVSSLLDGGGGVCEAGFMGSLTIGHRR